MRIKTELLFFTSLIIFGCYNPDEDITAIRNTEFSLIEPDEIIMADGASNYSFVIKLPGIRYGEPKEVTLESNWGKWANDASTTNLSIKYDIVADAYVDTVRLKASRIAGPFRIRIVQDSVSANTISLEAEAQFPSFVQIVSDSVSLKLLPNNSTNLKAFFFNDNGFPSDNTKFLFSADSDVNIFPREVFIDSSRTSATLQLATGTNVDTIQIYGEIPAMGTLQPIIDTLKIAITN